MAGDSYIIVRLYARDRLRSILKRFSAFEKIQFLRELNVRQQYQ